MFMTRANIFERGLITEADLVARYEKGSSGSSIAEEIGVSGKTVYNWLRALGVVVTKSRRDYSYSWSDESKERAKEYYLRNPGEGDRRAKVAREAHFRSVQKKMNEALGGNDPRSSLESLLRDTSLTKVEIAAQLGVHPSTLERWGVRLDVKVRRGRNVDPEEKGQVLKAFKSGEIKKLSTLDRQVLFRRYVVGEPLGVIGQTVGGKIGQPVCRESVRQRVENALKKLKS